MVPELRGREQHNGLFVTDRCVVTGINSLMGSARCTLSDEAKWVRFVLSKVMLQREAWSILRLISSGLDRR